MTNEPSPPAPALPRRRLLWLLAWTAGGLVLLLGGLLGLLASGLGNRPFVQPILMLVDRAIAGRIEIDAARLLPNGEVHLVGVRVRDPDGRVAASAERVDGRVSLLSLLHRHVRVTGGRAVGVMLDLSPLPSGGVGLANAFRPRRPLPPAGVRGDAGAPGWAVDLALESTAVRRFVLRPRPLAPPLVELDSLELSGTLHALDGETLIEARAGGGEGVAPLRGSLSAQASLRFSGGRFAGRGALALGDSSARGRWDLALGERPTGQIDLDEALLGRALLAQLAPWAALGQVGLSGQLGLQAGRWSANLVVPAGRGRLSIVASIDAVSGEGRARVIGVQADPSAFSAAWPRGSLDLELAVGARHLFSKGPLAPGLGSGGPDGGRRLTARLSLRPSTLGGKPLGPGEASLELSSRRVLLDRLALQIPGAFLTGKGRLGIRESALSLELDASHVALLREAAEAAFGARLPELAGVGAARLQVTGPLAHPAMSAQISAPELSLGGIVAQGLRGEIETPRLGRPVDLRGELTAEEVDIGGGVEGAPDLSGWPGVRRLGAVRIEGSWVGPTLALTAKERTRHGESGLRAELRLPPDLRGATLRSLELSMPSGDWRLVQSAHASFIGGLELRNLVLRSGPQRISVDGAVPNAGGPWAHVRLQSLDLAALPRDLVSTRFGLSGHVEGELAYQEPRGRRGSPPGRASALSSVRLSWRDGGLLGVRVSRLDLDLVSEHDELSGRVEGKLASGTVAGAIRWPLPGAAAVAPLEGSLDVQNLALGELARVIPALAPFQGTVSLDGRARGELRAPELTFAATIMGLVRRGAAGPSAPVDLAGHVALRASGLDFDAQASRQGRPLAKAAAGLRVEAESLLRALSSPSALLARLSLSPASLDASLGSVELAEIDRELDLGGELSGEASGELHLQGSLLSPRGSASLRLARLSFAGRELGDASLRLAATEAATRLQAEISGARAAGSLDGSLELALPLERLRDPRAVRVAALQGRLSAAGWPLALVEPASPAGSLLGGRVGAQLSLLGSLSHPALVGTAAVSDLEVRGQPQGSAHAELHWDGEVASLGLALRQPAGGALDLSARLPLAANDTAEGPLIRLDSAAPLSGELSARSVDLGFLSGIGDPVRKAAGLLDARLSIAGTLWTPVASGEVALARGELALVGLGDFREIEARARLSPSIIQLDELRAASSEGTLEAKGEIDRTREGAHLFSGQAETRDFGLWTGDALRGYLTSRLVIAGHFSRQGIVAELRALDAELRLPDVQSRELEPLSLPSNIVVLGGRPKAKSPGLPLDVHLVAPGPLEVTGSDLKAKGKADLWAHVDARGVRLRGRIDVSKGSLQLFGRTFGVDRATLGYGPVDGPGRAPDDPRLSALATETTPYAKVLVSVTGSLKAPEIDLTSEPPLSRQKISSLLATGTLPGAGGTSPGAGGGGVEASGVAASVAGAFLAGEIKGALGHYLPLDVLTLDPRHAEVGEHLGKRLYLGYVQNFGVVDPRINTNEIRAQYQLNREFSLDSEYGDAGAGRLDLDWKHDW